METARKDASCEQGGSLDDPNCMDPVGERGLLQTTSKRGAAAVDDNVLSKEKSADEKRAYQYKPRKARQALTYFKEWNMGLNMHADLIEKGSSQLRVQGKQLKKVLFAALARQFGCSIQTLEPRKWRLMEHERSNGVDHMLFRTVGIGTAGRLQYISKRNNHIIAADPPINCAGLQLNESPDIAVETPGSPGKLLHPERDELVADCKKLYERTAEDVCKKKLTVTRVLRAESEVIDGVEVRMDVRVKGPAGKETHHSPRCLFELHPNTRDASLLETIEDSANRDPTRGMKATLRTSSDLCEADEQDGENALMDVPAMGLLSAYKGYGHLEKLPRAKFAERDNLPQDFDMRTAYPKCFLENGVEAIRNQGSCGSCWAFAGASAIMNNLCASNQDSPASFASSDDRFEVSVQQLMSCNPDQAGCKGGLNYNVHTAALAKGLGKERVHPYQCAAGSAKDHWQQKGKKGGCSAFPWGADCQNDKEADWNYGGAFHISGETQIMTLLSQGRSLTVGMQVDEAFDGWGTGPNKKEVYDEPGGKTLGGHAMAAIGYGVQDGKKYWLIQNSWSPKWGDDGTIKVVRGANLHGIENGVFYFRSWVEGAPKPEMPECRDAEFIDGLKTPSGPVPCSGAGGYCDHPEFSANIKLSCPATCNVCPTGEVPAPQPSPPAPPPPKPTVAPAPPPPEPTVAPAPPPPGPPPAPPGTPAPAPSEDEETVIELGSSDEDEKCITVGENQQCEVSDPPCETEDEWSMDCGYMSHSYDDQFCVIMSGGWTKKVKLTCRPWEDFDW